MEDSISSSSVAGKETKGTSHIRLIVPISTLDNETS